MLDRGTSDLESAFEIYFDAAADYLHTERLAALVGSSAVGADRRRMIAQLKLGRSALLNMLAALPVGPEQTGWRNRLDAFGV